MAGRGDRMVQETVQPLATANSSNSCSSSGALATGNTIPPTTASCRRPRPLHLLASMLGTSSHCAPLLRELMCDAERHRFRNALEQAVSRRLNLNLELQLMNLHGDHATIRVKGRPIEQDGKSGSRAPFATSRRRNPSNRSARRYSVNCMPSLAACPSA